jgi:hypothetical protein
MKAAGKSATASLRIASRKLTAKEIARIMGLDPADSYEKGELITSKSPVPRYREEALCLFDSELPDNTALEEHLDRITAILETRVDAVSKLQTECDVEIFCSYASFNGQGGFILTSRLLERIVRLRVDIVFDLFLIEQN